MRNDFFKILKEKTTMTPSRARDSLILKSAAGKLSEKSSPWLLAFGYGVAALSFIVWIQTSQISSSNAILAESPEMLLMMDDVEILVEVSQYSEEDWNIVMNGES